MEPQRPTTTLKFAQTLDGRIAARSGDSRWVSGERSRVLAHQLRAEHDAVLVGVGTVLADDPQLNVRLCSGPDPLRIVVDSHLRTPITAAVLGSDPAKLLIATSPHADRERAAALQRLGVGLVEVSEERGGLDLQAVLTSVYRRGVRSVLVEGGKSIVTSFLRQRLVDALVVIVAPRLLGEGIDAVGDLGAGVMADALRLDALTVDRSDEDIVIRGRPVWESEAVRPELG